jgi:CheY-specific phosphatase CheX
VHIIAVAMTIEQVTALTELERDALGEIANIAMARAATSMRQMVGHQVLLSVPAVELLSREAAAQIVGTPDNRILVAVRQDFTGAFSGRALLIFPETSSLELMRAVAGRSLSLKDVIDLQDEALPEIGNVLLNNCPIKPMTLSNMYELGVPSLDVSCWKLPPQTVLGADRCRITSPCRRSGRRDGAHQKAPAKWPGAPNTDIYRRFLTRSST